MLTCIACSKLGTAGSLGEPPEDDENASIPSTKQAIKALTAQIKDMAVKASGAYKNCKPCPCSSGQDRGGGGYPDSEVGSASERYYGEYRRPGSSNSTPRLWGKDVEGKLKACSSGSATPVSVSGRSESVVFLEEDEPKEWVAQVEPGVLITFVSLPQGGNDLKRIRFNRDVFNKWQAQRWWVENHDRVMELYNVQRFDQHALPLPPPPQQSENENTKLQPAGDDPVTPNLQKEHPPLRAHTDCSSPESLKCHPTQPPHMGGPKLTSKPSNVETNITKTDTSSVDASERSSSSRAMDHSGELSASNASDLESEWVEQDEPGVYITIRSLPGGGRELRRVRFSREKFREMQARGWWEENKTRIQQQYL